jgi:hypothetical protein
VAGAGRSPAAVAARCVRFARVVERAAQREREVGVRDDRWPLENGAVGGDPRPIFYSASVRPGQSITVKKTSADS